MIRKILFVLALAACHHVHATDMSGWTAVAFSMQGEPVTYFKDGSCMADSGYVECVAQFTDSDGNTLVGRMATEPRACKQGYGHLTITDLRGTILAGVDVAVNGKSIASIEFTQLCFVGASLTRSN